MSLAQALIIDPVRVTEEITANIREWLAAMRRRGAVLGLSGGVDSSVVAALCVRALGKECVFGLFMPEADSAADSLTLGRLTARTLGIRAELEDIQPILAAAGCYRRRDDAIRKVIPAYDSSYRCKIILPPGSTYQIFSVVARSPDGVETRTRLPLDAYLAIVAATNFKQRTRKMMEYHHADRLNYAVAGTPNKLESDLGFFVKNGDGSADLQPIAHLYKSQVYQLAAYLGVPDEICLRPPTTDTYSLPQSQEEFYFTLPYQKMDLALYAHDRRVPAADAAEALDLTPKEVEQTYSTIDAKRKAAQYLHLAPLRLAASLDLV